MSIVLLGGHRVRPKPILAAALLAVLAIVSAIRADAAMADEGQDLFQQKCQGCHSLGQGKRVGPDLQGVTAKRDREWLKNTIVSPDRLIAQGDPIAKQLVQEYGTPMPNLGISSKDAEAIIAYLDRQSGPSAAPVAPANQPAAQPVAPQGDAALGRRLFVGEVAMANGGEACAACHTVRSLTGFGGGNLARDLTWSYANLGQAGLESILKTMPFPLMKAAFANDPLTDDELASLLAFMRQESSIASNVQAAGPEAFVAVSLLGFVVFAGLIQLVWRKRLREVRRPLVLATSRKGSAK